LDKRYNARDDKIQQLEEQQKWAQNIHSEAEAKYEEVGCC